MKLHLASGNAHKAREFQVLADGTSLGRWGRIEVLPATVAGGMPPVAEDTGSFAGNARKKAAALQAVLPPEAWVLADDSGLCVDALQGKPGVESAYYAGPQGDSAANLCKLIDVMRLVPAGRRSAHFACVLVVRGPGGAEQLVEGRCNGRLLAGPRGGAGFGYDPLFVPEGGAQTFAEMPVAEKNRISHRAKAWAQLAAWLRGRQPDA